MAPGLILLDRDGVLNRMVIDPEHGTVDSPMRPDQVDLNRDAIEAAARLSLAGWTLAICTNQPAAAKGKTTRALLEEAHQVVVRALADAGAPVAGSYICWHRAEDGCHCRKPRPGLLQQAIAAHGPAAWMVGDGVTDVEAANAAGVQAAFVGGTKCDICRVLTDRGATTAFRGDSLDSFAKFLLPEMS
jgi:D-glycero-D-manno-heptose 1,7-bisphosphate phosphatase